MRAEQDRHPLPGQAPDHRPHVAHAGGIEPGRRLVEQEQPWRAEQRCGNAEALAHPVRVAADLVASPFGQVDQVEYLGDPRGRVAAVVGGQQLQVLAPTQVRVEARRLDEAGDAVERAGAFDEGVAAEQLHVALGWANQAERHTQRRRLAGPVRAEEAVDVAGLDVEVDVIDGQDVAVALDQPARYDGRVAHRSAAAA